jgi:ribosomal subunit interface protein
MSKSLKTTNIILTPDINSYLNKKLDSLRKFINLNDDAVKCDVEIGKTTRHHQRGDIFRAEINIFVGKESFRAESESESIYGAIDLVKDEILHALRSKKERQKNIIRRTGERVKKFLRSFYGGN